MWSAWRCSRRFIRELMEVIWPPVLLAREWSRIAAALKPAIEQDPKRDWFDVAGELLTGRLQAWRVTGGYLVTEINDNGPLWVIYVAGRGGSLDDKRAMLGELETIGRKARCTEVRFEGRDWRKVFPDYAATQDDAGRWHFVKELR